MSPAAMAITMRVIDLPLFRRLFEAVHAVLEARLLKDVERGITIQQWNELIEAHDAIASEEP